MIDFESDASHLLLNPRLPAEERERLERLHRAAPDLRAHVWMATSGTTGALKLVGLAKRAILASAAAVNRHLDSAPSDVWCCVLPTFHVGGLGIHARAALSGARVVTAQWEPRTFVELCEAEGVTLASLVPAQVHDLMGLRAPASLRAIVVGGGALSMEEYERGRAEGWPLLPSYGMTETASQAATATLAGPELLLLDHLEARSEPDGRLAFRGASLLAGYATDDGFDDPKVDGWFVTPDLGIVEGRVVSVTGRAGDFVKIGGESVDLTRLDRILAEITADAAVVAVADERLGVAVHLAVAAGDGNEIAAQFNERVLPFERVRAAHHVATIPRSPLGKLRRAELAAEIDHSRNTTPPSGVISCPDAEK
ncbi:MAG TPA: AMP-binding protein [Thermoanaerobaculia bacterium]|nr:AMP-binding protein [Thermoanaerobaculia bacterium]